MNKNIKAVNFKKIDFFFLALFFLAFASLSYYYEPGVDDLTYHFNWAKGGSVQIQSMGDALSSQCHEYMNTNGRFLVHFIVQWLCGCRHYILYSLLNAFFATLLVYYVVSIIRYKTDGKARRFDIPLIIAFIVFLMPNIGPIFCGNMAMSVNYLWSGALYCGFLYYYFLLEGEAIKYKSRLHSFSLLFFAFICGTLQESYALGISAGLFIYHIIHIRETKGLELAYLIAFAIGVCILVFSPSNFSRFSSSQNSGLGVLNGMGIILNYYLFIFSFLFVLLIIYFRGHSIIPWIKGHSVVIISIITLLLFFLFIARTGIHQLTAVFLLLLLITIELIHVLFDFNSDKIEKSITIITTIVLVFVFIPILKARRTEYSINENFRKSILCSVDSVVCSYEFENFYVNEMPKSYVGRYISWLPARNCTDKLSNYCRVLDEDNLGHIKLALPASINTIASKCDSSTMVADSIFRYDLLNDYYIIKASEYVEDINQLQVTAYRVPTIHHFFRTDLKSNVTFDYLIVRQFLYEGNRYFLVKKPAWCVFDRRTSITYLSYSEQI